MGESSRKGVTEGPDAAGQARAATAAIDAAIRWLGRQVAATDIRAAEVSALRDLLRRLRRRIYTTAHCRAVYAADPEARRRLAREYRACKRREAVQ
jgi:hypothetical protein